MPEAIAIVVIFLISAAVYVGAQLHARTAVRRDPAGEQARLREHVRWLEHRLGQARREGWDDDMRTRIVDELAAAQRRLASMGTTAGREEKSHTTLTQTNPDRLH